MPINRQSAHTYATTTIQIGHKLSVIFADVIFKGEKGQRRENICDILDGKVKAPAAVNKFAESWINTYSTPKDQAPEPL